MFGLAMALLLAAVSLAQTPTSMVEFKLVVEAKWVGSGAKPTSIPRSMQRSLPDGSAEWDITTNGTAFRSALQGRYLDLPSGIIVLQQDAKSDRFVVNPVDRTFYGRGPEGLPADEALEGVSVDAANEFEQIAGFKAQKVVIQFRRPLPAEVRNAGGPSYMQTEIVNWCVPDLKLPAMLTAAIDRRVQAFTPRQLTGQVAKVCPVALRSSYRLVSSTPDFAIASTVTSIRRASPEAGLFEVPAGYQKIVPQ
jgi:hypothetical protein